MAISKSVLITALCLMATSMSCAELPVKKKDLCIQYKGRWVIVPRREGALDCKKRGGKVAKVEDGAVYCRLPKEKNDVLFMDDDLFATCLDFPEPSVDWSTVDADPVKECQKNGGKWTKFPDSCRDDCIPYRHPLCGRVFTQVCRCGNNRCTIVKIVGKTQKTTCVQVPWNGQFDERMEPEG